MKLHWFSPLPPAHTDIANYTARILPALAAQAEVTLWTDQSEWDATLSRHANVRPFSLDAMPWRELNGAGLVCYNLGNDKRHETIYRLSRAHPGLVFVHDFCIQQLIGHLYRDTWRDLPAYREHLIRFHGPLASYAADLYWRGEFSTEYMAEHFPMIELGLENALGVMVHTERARSKLQRDVGVPLAFHPLPYASTHARCDARARSPDERCRLIIFSYLGPNRRLETTFPRTRSGL